jgi:hypothetical protein
MVCPSCHKTLPADDRFCAYCGADLGWRLLPGVTVPRFRLPARWQITGGLAAAVGAVGGAFLAVPFASIWIGALVGALGLGASAMFADVVAAAIPDRQSAERFGQGLGALGGALVVPGGLLIGLIVTLWHGGPNSLRELGALLAAGSFLGLICAAGGALIGVTGGIITGGFAGRLGHAALRRQGAILGAAAAWTAAAVLGGLFAGDFAAKIVGASEPGSATAGLILQVLIGAALLPLARRVQRRWRGWFTGRP